MRHYADDPNVHARIYAMRSRLMTFKDYVDMVREQMSFSGRSENSDDFLEMKEMTFREQVKGVIHLAEAMSKYSPLFLGFLRQYEARNAKLLLARASGRASMELWYDIEPYAVLHRGLIDDTPGMEDLSSICAGTYLQDVFSAAAPFERLEIRIDSCAAQMMVSAAVPLTAGVADLYRQIMLRRVAVLSVIWEWRLRDGYGWSLERTASFLGDLYGIFGGQVALQVKIVQEALNRRIERFRKSGLSIAQVADAEFLLEQYYFQWISSMFHLDFHSVSCVVSYLWLLYYQIRNIFCIIDGVRFRLSGEDILKRIISEG